MSRALHCASSRPCSGHLFWDIIKEGKPNEKAHLFLIFSSVYLILRFGIQILTYSGDEADLGGDTIVVNSLHDARSLDEFEINIIDLSSKYFWYSKLKNAITPSLFFNFKADIIMPSSFIVVALLLFTDLDQRR